MKILRAVLQGVQIIEGMIQLLTDSLVFQLLIVQFVCTSWSRERARAGRWEKCRVVQIGKEEKTETEKSGLQKLVEGSTRVNGVTTVPSKSSMVFSSFATVLSANSARFSACKETRKQGHHPVTAAVFTSSWDELTSFSRSFMILISSSYLSSFSEY